MTLSDSSLPKRIHIVGHKNSGKTTLVVDLVKELSRQGHKVATIKHTHHHHELDTPGKDSHRHREAGATAVGIISPAMDAVFLPQDSPREATPSRYESLTKFFGPCDVVLVEGGQHAEGIKIEVWRQEISETTLSANDPTIKAIVSDDIPAHDLPILKRAEVARLAEYVLELTE